MARYGSGGQTPGYGDEDDDEDDANDYVTNPGSVGEPGDGGDDTGDDQIGGGYATPATVGGGSDDGDDDGGDRSGGGGGNTAPTGAPPRENQTSPGDAGQPGGDEPPADRSTPGGSGGATGDDSPLFGPDDVSRDPGGVISGDERNIGLGGPDQDDFESGDRLVNAPPRARQQNERLREKANPEVTDFTLADTTAPRNPNMALVRTVEDGEAVTDVVPQNRVDAAGATQGAILQGDQPGPNEPQERQQVRAIQDAVATIDERTLSDVSRSDVQVQNGTVQVTQRAQQGERQAFAEAVRAGETMDPTQASDVAAASARLRDMITGTAGVGGPMGDVSARRAAAAEALDRRTASDVTAGDVLLTGAGARLTEQAAADEGAAVNRLDPTQATDIAAASTVATEGFRAGTLPTQAGSTSDLFTRPEVRQQRRDRDEALTGATERFERERTVLDVAEGSPLAALTVGPEGNEDVTLAPSVPGEGPLIQPVARSEDTETVGRPERFGDVRVSLPFTNQSYEEVARGAQQAQIGAATSTAERGARRIDIGLPFTEPQPPEAVTPEERAGIGVIEDVSGLFNPGTIALKGKEAAEFSAEGYGALAESIARGNIGPAGDRGAYEDFLSDLAPAGVNRVGLMGEEFAEKPFKTAGGLAGTTIASYAALGTAQRLAGPRTARALSFGIQPGEELVRGAVRSGVVPERAGTLVPGVQSGQFGGESAADVSEGTLDAELGPRDPSLPGERPVGLTGEDVDEARGVTGASRLSKLRGRVERSGLADRIRGVEMGVRRLLADERGQMQTGRLLPESEGESESLVEDRTRDDLYREAIEQRAVAEREGLGDAGGTFELTRDPLRGSPEGERRAEAARRQEQTGATERQRQAERREARLDDEFRPVPEPAVGPAEDTAGASVGVGQGIGVASDVGLAAGFEQAAEPQARLGTGFELGFESLTDVKAETGQETFTEQRGETRQEAGFEAATELETSQEREQRQERIQEARRERPAELAFGFEFTPETPGERTDEDEPGTQRIADLLPGPVGGRSGIGGDDQAPGWVSETISTIATSGTGGRFGELSDEELKDEASTTELLLGEAPTAVMVRGGPQVQEQLAAVQDLLGAPDGDSDGDNGGDGFEFF